MEHRIVSYLGLAVLAWAVAAPASADPIRTAAVQVPPFEVMTIVRSAGFEPLTRPVRRGSTYVMRAIDDYGEEVQVVVGAQRGDILSVEPVTAVAAPYQGRGPVYVPRSGYVDPRYVEPRYIDPRYVDRRYEWSPETSDPTIVRPPRNVGNAPNPPKAVTKRAAPAPKAAAVTPPKPPARPTQASAPPKPVPEPPTAAAAAQMVTPAPAKTAAPASAIPPVQTFE